MALGVETPIANLRSAALKYYQPLFPDVLASGPDDTPAVGLPFGIVYICIRVEKYMVRWNSSSPQGDLSLRRNGGVGFGESQ